MAVRKRGPLADEIKVLEFTGTDLVEVLRAVAKEVKAIDADRETYVVGINTAYGTRNLEDEWLATLYVGVNNF